MISVNLKNIEIIVSIISNCFAIIAFLFVVFEFIFNIKYCKNIEKKFGIPSEYLISNFKKNVCEICEYVVSLAGVVFFVVLINRDKVPFIYKLFMLYACVFIFEIGTIGILFKNKSSNITQKTDLCCEIIKFIFIYVALPVIIIYIGLQYDIIMNIFMVIMIFFALCCVFIYVKKYFAFDNIKYDIIKFCGKYYVLFPNTNNNKFILVEVEKNKSDIYVVVEKGKYIFEENVNRNNVIKSKVLSYV